MDSLNDSGRLVICNVDNPSPIAFANVYEPGDLWVKIVGCDSCPPENRQKCCNNCGMFSEDRSCVWHLQRRLASTNKPWNCVVKPYPDAAMPHCVLEFKSVRGNRLGQIRRVADIGDVFQVG